MAFVYFEERFKEKGDLSKNQDGPGAYDDKPEPSPTQNLVPFLSSVPRHKETKRNSSLETPGPGAYSNVDPVATNRLETLELNLREKKIIINNSKPSSTFCSDSNRFPNEKKKLNVPGPGHYTYEVGGIALKASKSTKMLLEQPKGKNEFFIGNSMKLGELIMPKNRRTGPVVPSIPGSNNKFGYNAQNAESELVPYVFNEKNHEGTKRDCAGPGEYEVKGYFDQCKNGGLGKSKAIPWKRAMSQRLLPAPVSNAGPGAYDPNFNYAPLYKWKGNSFFTSQSSRSGALLRMSTAAKLKEKSNRFTNEPSDDEFEDDFEYLEVVPSRKARSNWPEV